MGVTKDEIIRSAVVLRSAQETKQFLFSVNFITYITVHVVIKIVIRNVVSAKRKTIIIGILF